MEAESWRPRNGRWEVEDIRDPHDRDVPATAEEISRIPERCQFNSELAVTIVNPEQKSIYVQKRLASTMKKGLAKGTISIVGINIRLWRKRRMAMKLTIEGVRVFVIL